MLLSFSFMPVPFKLSFLWHFFSTSGLFFFYVYVCWWRRGYGCKRLTVNGRQDVRDRREQAVNLWNHHVIARSGHKKPKSDHMQGKASRSSRSLAHSRLLVTGCSITAVPKRLERRNHWPKGLHIRLQFPQAQAQD